MFSIGSFAIIFDDRQRVFLCHRRDMDIWNLPGGSVEGGELPTEAVIREVKEETGLEIVVERLIGVYGKPDEDELVFAFECRVVGGQLSHTEEADACQYFDIEEIPSKTVPKQVARIYDALETDRRVIFRRQLEPSTAEWLARLENDPRFLARVSAARESLRAGKGIRLEDISLHVDTQEEN